MAAQVLQRFLEKAERALGTCGGGVFEAWLAETVQCAAGVCVFKRARAGRTHGAIEAFLVQILSGRARDAREGGKILVLRAYRKGQSAYDTHDQNQEEVTRHAKTRPKYTREGVYVL